ncbi:hypothetical protein ACLB2K_076311 [Fragaria x ananassa]
MRLKPKILKAIVQRPEFEQNGVVYVNNVLISMLPSQLRSYIESYMQKVDEKDEEIGSWLSENDLPADYFKSDIMKTVLENLEEDKEVDVEDILSILPESLEECIREYMQRLKVDRKIEEIDDEIDFWLIKIGIPESKKWDIKKAVQQELNKDVDTDVENFLSTVEWIQEFIPFNRLKKVKILEVLDESVLKAICKRLEPEKYDLRMDIIREGQPLQMILFVEGFVWFENERDGRILEYSGDFWGELLVWPSSTSFFLLKDDDDSEELVRREGEVYGEELLEWVIDTSFPALTPLSTHTAYNDDDNAAVVLSITAEKLKSVGSKFRSYFSTFRKESRPDLLTFVGLTMLKIMPELKTMDEEVLKAISQSKSTGGKKIQPRLDPHGQSEFCPPQPSPHTSTPEEAWCTRCRGGARQGAACCYACGGGWACGGCQRAAGMVARLVQGRRRPGALTAGMGARRRQPREEIWHIKLERNGDGVDIITGGEPLDRMLFVLRGNLVIDYGSFKMGLAPGQFFGEELVDRLARCSDATRPLSNHKVTTKYFKDTELLVLMANDLESVASQFKFKSHFS